jgi:2-desacetyl-2-hydroxyethyl bacteriochlorophyllide A dehydrogenase
MKAAWLKDWKELALEDRPVPKIGHGEVLIRVKYAGICGSDLHVYNGHHATAIKPVILGHEFSGEIVEIDPDCHTGLKAGDRVVVQPYTSCGTCDICVQGRDNVCKELKIFGIHQDGCFAEYIKVPIKKVYRIPEGVDMKLATITEPLAVAVHDVRRSALSAGQTAMVIGGGPIGVLIALVARLSGASRIVVSEVNEYRIAFLREMGFTVVNPMKEDAEKAALAFTDNGEGFDVVFEVSGTLPGAALMTRVARIGGKIVVIGIPKGKCEVDTGAVVAKELELLGVRVHAQVNFAAAIDIIAKGDLNNDLRKVITDEYSLDDIQKAIDFSQEDQKHLKVVIRI